MGRIKTTLTKRVAEELLEKHPDSFKDNFKENKEILKNISDIPSKKLKNAITGYLTRMIKKKAETS